MFWFNKNDSDVVFIDKTPRPLGCVKQRPNFECKPDIVMDFTNLKFKNKTFKLVVFDPPHLRYAGKNGWMAKKYGVLSVDWEKELQKGFIECWRVLKDDGILIFKWNEYQIPLSKVLKLFNKKPLFGHRSGKGGNTHWLCFMKK